LVCWLKKRGGGAGMGVQYQRQIFAPGRVKVESFRRWKSRVHLDGGLKK